MHATDCCLVVDDDTELRSLIAAHLRRCGFAVREAGDAASALESLRVERTEVVLLDLMLPDGDGIELCRRIRAVSDVPVLMLTAQGDPLSRVLGLEMGADDFITKPFEARELVARIRAVLRRTRAARPGAPRGEAPAAEGRPGPADDAATGGGTLGSEPPASGPPRTLSRPFDGWRVDWRQRVLVDPRGFEIALSNAEYRLLAAFAEHPGRVLSRELLLTLTRAAGTQGDARSVDLAVSRLRAKLGDAADRPRFIETVRGRGYQFLAAL